MSTDVLAGGLEKAFSFDRTQFNLFFDKMLDGFAYHKIVVDKSGKPVDYVFVEVNHAFEQMTGLKREQIIGKKVTDVLIGIEKDPTDWIGIYGKVALSGEPIKFENHAESLDKWFKVSAYCPEKGYFVALFEDITERKKAEETLMQREEELRQHAEELEKLMDIIPTAVWISRDPKCENITGNQAANSFYESEKGENVSAGPNTGQNQDTTRRFFSDGKELKPQDLPMQKAAAKNVEIRDSELEVLLPSNRKITILGNAKPLLDDTGKVRGCLATFIDITERKKAEEVLLESERRLNRSQKIAHLGSWELDLVKNKLSWSDEIYRIFGLKPQEFNATYEAFLQAVHPNDRESVDSAYRGSLREGRDTYEIEHRVVRKSTGEIRIVYEKCEHVRDETGKIIRSIGMVQDITERKKAEEATARQAELIDLSPDAIIVRKLDGTVTFWSKGAEKLYGWSKDEAVGQVIHTLLMTEFPRSLKEVLKELKLVGKWSGEICHTCKNGDKVFVQSYWLGKFNSQGEIVEMLESNVDVTERIRMQAKLEESAVVVEEYANQMEEIAAKRAEQLKDAERLAAIGTTAGMVGHDIRNPLQSIIGDLFLVKTDLAAFPDGEEKNNMQESLCEIEKNVDYINKIVADLQDFARPLEPNLDETDMKFLIDQLLNRTDLPKNIIVSTRVEIGARKVVVDSTFINRIMNNLVNNAVQAMPNGGKLCVHVYREANETVIKVKDTGVGIPEAVKGKLFNPMFTTKAKGQGFGLAVVKRMSEALGGSVVFESLEGKGTTFIVRFPAKMDNR